MVNAVPPKDRDIAMVFQSYALYPTMTVRENITFGMESRARAEGRAGRRRRARRRAPADRASCSSRKPGQLSGGQRQRVAMGRALVRDPALFLFDEPLSNLDAKLRVEMRTEIKKLHQRVGKTTVYVTHDQVEAMTLASRIAVMHQGELQQFDEPRDGLRPAGQHVRRRLHGLAGDELPSGRDRSTTAAAPRSRVQLADGKTGAACRSPARWPAAPGGRKVVLGIRPEHIFRDDPDRQRASRGIGTLDAPVEVVEPTGAETMAVAARRRPRGRRPLRARRRAARSARTSSSASTWRKACLFDPETERLI